MVDGSSHDNIILIIELPAPSDPLNDGVITHVLSSGTDVDNLAMEFEVSYTLDNEQQFWDGKLNHPISCITMVGTTDIL